MFGNCNKSVVFKLSNKHYKSNRVRNIVCVIAIALTAYMLITVFSLGFNYLHAYKMHQIRLLGTTGQASLNNPSDFQIHLLENNEDVECVGIREDVIRAGNVEYKEADSNIYYAFRYYDKTEWNAHRVNAISNIVGDYPSSYNELMVPLWVLKKMGIDSPDVGQKLALSYKLDGIWHDEGFILSGYFDEYDNPAKDGSVGYILVSEEYADKNKDRETVLEKIADISFRSNMSDEEIFQLESNLNLSEKQTFSLNPNYQSGENYKIIILMGFIVLCIVISGYLLIYNTFCISVVSNVRYFGLLKGIGITRKQIREVLILEGVRMTAPGIIIGSVLGYLFSSFIIPFFLRNFIGGEYYPVKCNVWVVLGTILFTVFTVIIAMFKPAALGGKVSPIEALRFNTVSDLSKTTKAVKKRVSWGRLALYNVVKDKKKSLLVVVSMAIGITSCVLVSTLISSISIDNYIEQNMGTGIELKNKTMALGYGEYKQVFSEELVEKIESIKGVEHVKTVCQQLIIPDYSDETFGNYVNSSEMEGVDKEYIVDNPELFYCQLIGMDIDEYDREKYKDIDWEAFDSGNICLIPKDDNNPIPIGTDISYRLGEYDATAYKAKITDNTGNMIVGGYIDGSYSNYGSSRTIPPHFIVSHSYLDRIKCDGFISNIMIDFDSQLEQDINTEVCSILDECYDRSDIVVVSALEKKEGLKQTKISLYGIGGSLSMVIAIIGIVNFINYTYCRIVERRHDFTVMESIGVQKKQIARLVIYEGLIYYGFVMLVVATLGNLIVKGIFHYFASIVDYAIFTYPVLQFVLIGMFMLVICFMVPWVSIRRESGKSVVERLNHGE